MQAPCQPRFQAAKRKAHLCTKYQQNIINSWYQVLECYITSIIIMVIMIRRGISLLCYVYNNYAVVCNYIVDNEPMHSDTDIIEEEHNY